MPCDMKDIELGIRLLANSTKDSGIDTEKLIHQIYLNRGDSNIKNRGNIQRAFIDVT